MIAVSVIMPVYNTNPGLLHRAVKSVLAQSLKNIELILVDDGSSNGCDKICDEYYKVDRRIKVIHQTNSGICKARNSAIAISRGEYIAFCDHDDEYGTDLLKDNYRIAKMNDADIVKYGVRYVCLDKKAKFPFDEISGKVVCNGKKQIKEEYSMLKNAGVLTFVWDGIYKSSFIKKNQVCFNERFKVGQEDVWFCNEIIQKAKSFVYNPDIYYIHYRYNSSTSRGMDKEKSNRLINDEMVNCIYEIELLKVNYYVEEEIKKAINRNAIIMISTIMRDDFYGDRIRKKELMSWLRNEMAKLGDIDCRYNSKIEWIILIKLFKMESFGVIYICIQVYKKIVAFLRKR